jgi:hypothetical protein
VTLIALVNRHLQSVGVNEIGTGVILTLLSFGEVWLYNRTKPKNRTRVWNEYRRVWKVSRFVCPGIVLLGVGTILVSR